MDLLYHSDLKSEPAEKMTAKRKLVEAIRSKNLEFF
jgi:hypothetical protein